ncbi:MAG: HAMP domain-containing sensor histidine kinase [Candidatus Geothermincolia bacterium]
MSRRNHRTLMEAHHSLEQVLELDGHINKQVGMAHALVSGQGGQKEYDESRDKVQSYFDDWVTELNKDGRAASTTDLAEVHDIERSYGIINGSLNEAVSLLGVGRASEAMQKLDSVLSDGYERGIRPKIHALIAENRVRVTLSEARANGASGAAETIAWLALSLGVLVAVALPVVLVKDVIGSLDRLRRGIQRVSDGDYSSPIEIRKRDEFGDLAMQFNKMSRDAELLLQSEKQTATARAEAAAAERHAGELRNLIDIAAHELRHPATLFMGYSELLINSGGDLDDEMVTGALQDMYKASIRLSGLVTELFDSSRIESGPIELDLRPADPWAMLETASRDVGEDDTDANIHIAHRVAGIDVLVDSEKLIWVLVILLENAIKFSPPGSPIETWYELHEDEAVFFVADRGSGIPQEESERVFERFYQVGDVLQHSLPGIGLSLYIAKKVVTACGGWIRHEPRSGGGSVFLFGVPADQAEAEDS